jgi:hypothetical protein
MLAKILELLTGKDDLERVAYKEDLALLNAYLKKRRLWFPQRPKTFLDPSSLTQEQVLEQTRQDAEQLSGEQFEPWVLEVDGKKRLPAFSSQKKDDCVCQQSVTGNGQSLWTRVRGNVAG